MTAAQKELPQLSLSRLFARISRPAGWLLVALSIVLLVSVGFLAQRIWTQIFPPAARGGEVHGFVAADLRELSEKGLSSGIRLPNVTVSLKNLATGAVGPPATTDYHGYFRLRLHAPGQYQLCAEAPGFATSCESTPISIGATTVVLRRDLSLAPMPGVLRGHVLLADGNPCYHERLFFGPPTVGEVQLIDRTGAAAGVPVVANSRGQYILPKVAGPGSYGIKVTCAGAQATRSAIVGANDLGGVNPFDVTLANASPTISRLTIKNAAGVPIRWASPGEVVEVMAHARDPDDDRLHYKWGDGSPGLASVDAPTIRWKLAAVPAINELFVEVTDDKGGFANRRVAVATGPPRALFSGRVSETGGAPMAGVTVNVHGTATTTDAQGNFEVAVGESHRYVVTVRKPGYALLSRVFTNGVSALDLRLERMQRRVCKPTTSCTLQEEGRKARATVTIEANSVVDGQGRSVTAPYFVDIHAYDLTRPNPIPGDFGGFDQRGRPIAMISYGAADVELTDSAGKPLKLRPGARARLRIAIDPDRLATAPAAIPFLSYDPATGLWNEETQGTRVGDWYEATVGHLSVWNADVVFTNTACMKVEVFDLDAKRRAPPFPFTLAMDVQGVRHEFTVVEPINVLYRLPPNTNVALTIHPVNYPFATLNTFKFNSGAAIDAQYEGAPHFGVPPFPYDDCKAWVALWVDVPSPAEPFLSRFDRPQQKEVDTPGYYNAIGAYDNGQPSVDRGNFDAWKKTNGLSLDPATPAQGEIAVVYYNDRDFQLGFDVHCKQTGSDVACYQTIYPGAPCGHARCPAGPAIADTISHQNASWTLAMEYSPLVDGGASIVKFFAFDSGGGIAEKVVLDSEGPKDVPNVCLACHPSRVGVNVPNADQESTFLPFDVFRFKYDAKVKTLANQQENFRALNDIVRATKPNATNPHDPIGNLIAGMFAGGKGTPPNDDYVPPGWKGHENLYQTISRPYCRSCHNGLGKGFDFQDYIQWGDLLSNQPTVIYDVVCRFHEMPMAEVPFLNFWTSTNPVAPLYLAAPLIGLDFTKFMPPGCPRS